jgi:hypothetical protein
MPNFPRWAIALLVPAFAMVGMAQQPRQYTKEDYAKAEKFMPYNVGPLAYTGVVRAKWLEDGRFWYRDYKPDGWDYVVRRSGEQDQGAGLRSGQTRGRSKGRGCPAQGRRAPSRDQRVISFPSMPRSCWLAWARAVSMRSQRRRRLRGRQGSRGFAGRAIEAGRYSKRFAPSFARQEKGCIYSGL